MRTLILLRHAKTESRNPGGDHARQLVQRGVEDCALITGYLQKNNLVPDHALVSDAARTRETISHVQPAMAQGAEISFSDTLYLAEADQIAHEIRAVPDTVKTLLVVGHNPGMHTLAYSLATQGAAALRRTLIGQFPTAAMAVLSFDVANWSDVPAAEGTLEHFVTAKSLREPAAADAEPDDVG